ncbi:MAG TPA: DUF6644 family protein [Gammaproteobacteria bacterium]
MSLLEAFHALEYSPLLVAMRSSPWLFPAIATLHLFGLTILGGTALVFDLRLLGFGLTRRTPTELAGQTTALLATGAAIMLATGIFLFMCFATKYYYLTAFWVKLAAICGVVALTITVRRGLRTARGEGIVSSWRKPLATISLSLWLTIALCGRLIGFP